ncbi:Uncharacterized protein DAT39_008014, partial [Clarias magur]
GEKCKKERQHRQGSERVQETEIKTRKKKKKKKSLLSFLSSELGLSHDSKKEREDENGWITVLLNETSTLTATERYRLRL